MSKLLHLAALSRKRSVSAFDLSQITWDTIFYPPNNVWNTGTSGDPAANGETIENIGDFIGNTKFLTQATEGNRPTYRSAAAELNGMPAFQGDNAANRHSRWERASPLSEFSLVFVGAFEDVDDYRVLLGNFDEADMLWINRETDFSSEELNWGGGTEAVFTLDDQPHLWTIVVSPTAANCRFGKDGLCKVPLAGASGDLTGITAFGYPTSGSFARSSGHLGLVGVYNGIITQDLKYPNFLQWAANTYDIEGITSANVLCVGDSRTNGYNWLDAPVRRGKLWVHLLKGLISSPCSIIGSGVNSRTQDQQNLDFATEVLQVFAESIASKKIVLLFSPCTNNMTNAATEYAKVVTFIGLCHAQGILVGVSTTPSFDGVNQTILNSFNALVMANSGGADGVVDIAADAGFHFTAGSPDVPANYDDNVHLSDLGNAIVAPYFETLLASAPFSLA